MFNQSSISEPADPIHWESQLPGTITLSPAQMTQAARWSQPLSNPDQQWQTYLNGLALLGFEQWLHQRAPDLSVSDEQSSLRTPIYASLINAACHLQVEEFKLCVLTMGSLTDSQVSVPRAVLDLPEFAAHFYVLVEVLEESEQVRVQGYFSYDQWLQQQHERPTVELDWNYAVPLQWFTPEPDTLLLALRCLNSQTVSLPIGSPASEEAIAAIRSKITSALPQLQSQKRRLWQILTWDEGATLLKSPDLMTWLSSQLIAQNTASQRAINTAFWLREQLDAAAQSLSLMLMPNLSSAFRSLRDLASIRADLAHNGIQIPPEARGTYQDLQWQNFALRLYSIIWALPAASDAEDAEWALLLVLGAQPDAQPPFGIKLTIRNSAEILVEESLEERSNHSYLYAQVIDYWDETFQVQISLNQEIMTTLLYQFQPEGL